MSTYRQANKSLYIFLCSLLGALLFVAVHRFLIMLILLWKGQELLGTDTGPLEFLAFDYVTMTIAVLAGLWYGVWLGLHWYNRVYEQGNVRSLMGSVLFRRQDAHNASMNKIAARFAAPKRSIEREQWQLTKDSFAKEGAAENNVPVTVKPVVKRRVVRKKPVTGTEV